MPRIEVEPGVELYVQDVGAGPPVVLIAGFGLSHEVWDREVRELGAAHRVVCVDLRGTGGSDKPIGDYSIARHSRDVLAMLEALDLCGVTLVGWSFGGQVAFHLTATAPERVARLALVCSGGARAGDADSAPRLLQALVAGEREDRLAARRKTIASGFAGEPPHDAVEFLLRVQLQMPSWAAVACYESYLGTDLTDLIDRVTVPVLQVLGAEDPVTPRERAAALRDRLADSRIVELPGCGHYPMLEAGRALDEALVRFAAGDGDGAGG